MTSENTKIRPEENKWESMLSNMTMKIDTIDGVLRHVYNAVTDVASKADEIFDAIEYHRDSPPYNSDMGFLDGLDE